MAHRAGQMFEAMLLAPILRPMVANAGMLGDYELDMLAQAIAERDQHGFGALVEARLQNER